MIFNFELGAGKNFSGMFLAPWSDLCSGEGLKSPSTPKTRSNAILLTSLLLMRTLQMGCYEQN